jgi:hypothetical protein
VEEAFAPLADDFAPGIQPSRNEVVGQVFGGQKDDFGAKDLKIWQRIFGGSMLELPLLILSQNDREWAFSRHNTALFLCRGIMPLLVDMSSANTLVYLRIQVLSLAVRSLRTRAG